MDPPQDCPICGTSVNHLNNHIRMSNGDGHGPTQSYPDRWDSDSESLVPDDAGTDLDLVDESDQEESEAIAIEINDRPSDMRDYQCQNDECGATVDYLDAECANEHEQTWYA